MYSYSVDHRYLHLRTHSFPPRRSSDRMSHWRSEPVGPLEELTSRLELRPLTGRYDAGAVVTATVAGQDKMFGLTELRFAGGRLKVPHLNLPLGQALRVRIRARDVSIALAPPKDISILNVIPCVIAAIGEEKEIGRAHV